MRARARAVTFCFLAFVGCKPREDIVGCLVHDGSAQYCLQQGPPLADTARLYALDECRSVNGTLVEECPLEHRIGRCDWPTAQTSSSSQAANARRTYYYADPGGLKHFNAEAAQRECRAGTWVAETAANGQTP